MNTNHKIRVAAGAVLLTAVMIGVPVLFAGTTRAMIIDDWFRGLHYAMNGLLTQLLAAVLILTSLTVNPILRILTPRHRRRRLG